MRNECLLHLFLILSLKWCDMPSYLRCSSHSAFVVHKPSWLKISSVLSFKALHSSTHFQYLDLKSHFRYSLFFVGPGMLLLNTKWFFYKLREWRYLMELICLTSHLKRHGLNAPLSLSHKAIICGFTALYNWVHSEVTSNFSAEACNTAIMSLSHNS